MMFLYNRLLLPAGYAGYRLAGLFDTKAREFFALRKGLFPEAEKTARELPGAPEKKRALFHAASVGELLMAAPLMTALAEQGEAAVILAYTSPSAARHLPRDLKADAVLPSPLDFPKHARRFLETLKPSLLVFTAYDVWPNLLLAAEEMRIPALLANAQLPENSGRLRFPARAFFSRLYPRLSAVAAVSEEDAARFSLLGVPREKVVVTGNCRFDKTLTRAASVQENDPDLSPLPESRPLLVAGSTWPEDHARLLPPLLRLLKKHQNFSAVVAPHEPEPGLVRETIEFFSKQGIPADTYLARKRGERNERARVVVVDTVGVLYKLYKRADMAFIGGSFKQGVHNTMEPAAMAAAVLMGPVHQNSHEALLLLTAGAAVCVRDENEIEAALERWLAAPEERKTAGLRAKQVVEANAGSTQRTLSVLRRFL